jgi:hypothetical protein
LTARQQPSAIERALAALRAAGWPDVNGIDLQLVIAGLLAEVVCADDAAQAVPAALAQLIAETTKSTTYIDIDLCTGHLLVLRQRDQVRHFSIDYVLSAISLVSGSPFLPHDNNNLH